VAELLRLDEAVRELVHDGDSVALEGFTQSERTFVEQVHFRSSVPGSGAMVVITDLGELRLDPDEQELVLTRVHPGVAVDQVRSETGWDLRVADELAETAPPSEEYLRVLRQLKSALGKAAV
jgi:glutaconate CoA-transferase subunit B